MIHLSSNRFYADCTVNTKSKIKRSRTNRQHLYITFGCIYINFFSEKTGFKILEKINTVRFLITYHFTYLLKPFVKATLIRSVFFIFQMCGQSFLSNFIYEFGKYLL